MANLLHLLASNQRRGAETFGVELGDELRRRGHGVEVLAVAPSTSGPHLDVEVAGPRRFDPRGVARIVARLRQRDLLVCFGSISLQTGALAAAIARRPFIYRNIGDPSVWQADSRSTVTVGRPLRNASRVVAVFPQAAVELIDRYQLDPGRVRTIPRGSPADRFEVVSESRRRTARDRLGLSMQRPWVAYIGSLSSEKRPDLAIASVAAHADAGIIICGDGPLRQRVEEQDILPPDRFCFLGPVDDVSDPLAASDLVLLTSETEGVPGVAVEAGLCGIPVVAASVGGIPFLVIDDETGILVDDASPKEFAAAISRALRERDRLGSAARTRCEQHFSINAVGAEWDRLIKESLAEAVGLRPTGTPRRGTPQKPQP